MRSTISALALILLLSACRSQPRVAGDAVDSSAHRAQPDSDANLATVGAPWFREEREIDLTGDGRPDTIIVRADGPSSDRLLVTLSFRVDGAERWREQWHSDYMLIDPPEFPEGEPGRAAYIRRGLRRTLEGVSVKPFDSANYGQMADSVDSTIIRQPPREQILLGYGYETTLAVAWDPVSKSFRHLWACC
jgi:hypothetical protein